jgi:Zn-dependent peptidase ImmA (M78 family)/transcriptional regulator with XRE-family HTH domain
MDRITSINRGRLAWSFEELGLSFPQISAETGLDSEKLAAVLEGKQGLTFRQLQILSEYLGRSVLFFLDPHPVDLSTVHSAQFRTLAGQKPDLSRRVRNLVKRAERQRALYLDLLSELDGVERPSFRPPIFPSDPVVAAGIARDWLGLGDSNSFSSYRSAIEARGILVFRTNGYSGKWQIAKESPILGFSLYDSTLPVIVVKKEDAEARQSFTLMHELGHVLMHRTSSVDDNLDLLSTNGMEREANQFAAHLLVPDRLLAELLTDDIPAHVSQLDDWLRRYRRVWGVSADVVLLRLISAGRLPRKVFDEYRQWKLNNHESVGAGGSREYRYREPGHIFGDRYVRTILGALSSQRITLSRASDYLDGLKVKDLHKLEQYYAGA